MFRPHTIRATRPARRGNTLILTLSCLSLLAVVGITAVYFTGDQATRAKNQGLPGPDEAFVDNGMGAFQSYLSVLVYDTPDSGQGMLNALRGHSLMATMYSRVTGATTAWDGVGAFGATNEFVTVSFGGVPEPQFPRVFLVNHRVLPAPGPGLPNWFDPEWSGPRPGGTAVGSGPGQTFIPKNAAYTYPDLNNFFLASICPATGEVLLPSYFRPNTPGSFGSLNPSNPNWRNGTGIVQIVRPTQALNPQFPLVPQNQDPSWTGDVRNRPGGYFYNGQYVARNDSIWIDIGLPAFTLPSGRRVKPLVAPLVLDLDSYLNLNIHGNLLNGGTAHGSGQGWGKWEVSLQKVLGAEGVALVAARGTNQTRGGVMAREFDPRQPGQPLPSYASVAWTGGGGAHPNSLNLPGVGTGPLFATNPAYRAAPAYSSLNAPENGHPSLRNPNEWTWGTTATPPRSFSLGDTLLFHSRHAGPPSFYASMEAGTAAPTLLRGTRPVPIPNPPAQTTTNGYRLDPAHAIRGIFTPDSTSLDRSGLTPGNAQVRAANAGIGGVDMNRRLADYRAITTAALSPTNLAPMSVMVGTQTVRQAEADRQAFARDIFARLIVVVGPTGAPSATVNPDGSVTINPAAPAADIDALRVLAQIAVNMVDYRDEDEVSTPFIWNPANPSDPFLNAGTFTATDLSNRVVFGVEKSRLVINEATAEQVNDPADGAANMAPTGNSQIRFWLELLNPGGGASGPLDDGGAQLYEPGSGISPYRIEIARYARPNAMAIEDLGSYLQNPANVTGSFDPAYQPEIRFLFDAAAVNLPAKQRVLPNAATYADATGNMTQGFALIAPTVPNPAKPAEFNPTAPNMMTMMPNPPWDRAIIAAGPPAAGNLQNTMAYRTGVIPAAADVNRADFKRHVVLLRRLANPHLPESALNPYVTVDYMDHVPAFDAVSRLAGDMTDRANFTPIANRYAIGKVQPQAGLSVGTPPVAPAVDPTYSFPQSMVLAQNPTTPVAGQPKHTFGRHNGQGATAPVAATFTAPVALTDTVMAPYEWLVHLDRPLINQLELIHVTTGKPHELTQQFIRPNATATSVLKHTGSLYDGTATSSLFTSPRSLYRMLELLRVQSRTEGEAFGGRVQGLININTIQDKRVWDSLFDADVNNNIFTQADVDRMWNALIASRTVNRQTRHSVIGQPLTDTAGVAYNTPIPGATIYDTNTATGDRPFLPFGVSQHAAGVGSILPGGTSTHVYAGGQGIDDTILRRDANGVPHLFVPGMHPYQQTEAARKILNSTTTVSNTFAVWVTVGYFDVVSEIDSPVVLPSGDNAKFVTLGNEYFREVIGDTRHKFFAVVKRANVGLDPASYQTFLGNPAIPPVHANPAGGVFFTTVEANANANSPTPTIVIAAPGGQVYSDGVPVTVGGTLVIGVGANREIVTVASVAAGANGLSTVTLAAPLTKNHQAGECVSNIVPGNPGPRGVNPAEPAFDVNHPMYKPVVPFWSRVP